MKEFEEMNNIIQKFFNETEEMINKYKGEVRENGKRNARSI